MKLDANKIMIIAALVFIAGLFIVVKFVMKPWNMYEKGGALHTLAADAACKDINADILSTMESRYSDMPSQDAEAMRALYKPQIFKKCNDAIGEYVTCAGKYNDAENPECKSVLMETASHLQDMTFEPAKNKIELTQKPIDGGPEGNVLDAALLAPGVVALLIGDPGESHTLWVKSGDKPPVEVKTNMWITQLWLDKNQVLAFGDDGKLTLVSASGDIVVAPPPAKFGTLLRIVESGGLGTTLVLNDDGELFGVDVEAARAGKPWGHKLAVDKELTDYAHEVMAAVPLGDGYFAFIHDSHDVTVVRVADGKLSRTNGSVTGESVTTVAGAKARLFTAGQSLRLYSLTDEGGLTSEGDTSVPFEIDQVRMTADKVALGRPFGVTVWTGKAETTGFFPWTESEQVFDVDTKGRVWAICGTGEVFGLCRVDGSEVAWASVDLPNVTSAAGVRVVGEQALVWRGAAVRLVDLK